MDRSAERNGGTTSALSISVMFATLQSLGRKGYLVCYHIFEFGMRTRPNEMTQACGYER